MFGMGEKKNIGFVDLSNIERFGRFIRHFKNPDRTGTEVIEYQQAGEYGSKKIFDIFPESVKDVPASEKSNFSFIKVLVAGERGTAPFLNEYLGDKGKFADMIKNAKNMREYNMTSRAVAHSQLRASARGKEDALKEQVENVKIIDSATNKRDFQYNRQRKTGSSLY